MDERTLLNCKTVAFPSLQMHSLGIHYDEQVITQILKNIGESSKLSISTPYFNLFSPFKNLLLNNKSTTDILVAHPKSNGFYNSKGLSYYIPNLYSKALEELYTTTSKQNKLNFSLYEYEREDWTFHAKGIWINYGGILLSVIGSSNYSSRSIYHDLESQIVILTTDSTVIGKFEEEEQNIKKYAHQVTSVSFNQKERKLPTLIKLLWVFIRRFM